MKTMLLYKAIAGFYDLLDIINFRNFEKSPRKAVLEFIDSQDKVLDLCTGTATNAIRIAGQRPRAKIVGIDISKDMLRVAREKVKKHMPEMFAYIPWMRQRQNLRTDALTKCLFR